MGCGRAFYIFLFPQLLTVAAAVLAIITFFSGYQHATGLKNVHFMTLDMSDVKIEGQSVSGLLSSANLSSVYTVGANGWCYGDSKSQIKGCQTPSEPFYFSLDEVLSTAGYKDLIERFPSEVKKYDNISKQVSWGIWGAFLAAIVLAVFQFLTGFFAMCSNVGTCVTSVLATLAVLASIIGAGLATGMYYVYVSKINDAVGELGVKATLDKSGLGFAWATAAALIIADFLFCISSCCSARRTRYVQVPEKHEPFEY